MKLVGKTKNGFIVRLATGEELIVSLAALARKEKIRGAWFWALGAADDVEIAFYDLRRRKYVSKRVRERLEILNITGNIALKGKEIIIHAHGVFSRPDCTVLGGHIVRCRTSATCEVFLVPSLKLARKHDSGSGLNLLT